MPAFEFIPVLSESWPGDWRGETGLVTEALSRYKESFKNYDAYLCGPPPMIDAATSLLGTGRQAPECLFRRILSGHSDISSARDIYICGCPSAKYG